MGKRGKIHPGWWSRQVNHVRERYHVTFQTVPDSNRYLDYTETVSDTSGSGIVLNEKESTSSIFTCSETVRAILVSVIIAETSRQKRNQATSKPRRRQSYIPIEIKDALPPTPPVRCNTHDSRDYLEHIYSHVAKRRASMDSKHDERITSSHESDTPGSIIDNDEDNLTNDHSSAKSLHSIENVAQSDASKESQADSTNETKTEPIEEPSVMSFMFETSDSKEDLVGDSISVTAKQQLEQEKQIDVRKIISDFEGVIEECAKFPTKTPGSGDHEEEEDNTFSTIACLVTSFD